MKSETVSAPTFLPEWIPVAYSAFFIPHHGFVRKHPYPATGKARLRPASSNYQAKFVVVRANHAMPTDTKRGYFPLYQKFMYNISLMPMRDWS